MIVVVKWVLSSTGLGGGISSSWFSWLQKCMAWEKAGHAMGWMHGKRGFLAKASRNTGGQALPCLTSGRSCTFPEYTELSLHLLNPQKLHPHHASQQSAWSSLYKRHFKIIFKCCTVPLTRMRNVRGHWRLLSFPLIYFCSVCDFSVIFHFMATFYIFPSPGIIGSAFFWHYPVQIVVHKLLCQCTCLCVWQPPPMSMMMQLWCSRSQQKLLVCIWWSLVWWPYLSV